MLEVGCGVGRLFPGFTEMFDEVWGVDVSQEMIKAAKELHGSHKVTLATNNGYDLSDICDNNFDFVFSYTVFQHAPERWIVFSYLAETFRILEPGGVFQLHFRAGPPTFKAKAARWLPPPVLKLMAIGFDLVRGFRFRRTTLRSVSTFGDYKTWWGICFAPEEIRVEAERLGFTQIQTSEDTSHPTGSRFWASGRKPGHETRTRVARTETHVRL